MQQTVYTLAASPDFDVDGIVFAAGDEGLFRSTDGGTSWRPALAALQLEEPMPVTCVLLSPAFGTERLVYAGAPGGVLHSTDGGETWGVSLLPAPPPTISVLAIAPNFERDGLVIAGTHEDGVLRSIDRGVHWQPWNFGLLDLHVLAVAISPAFADDNIVYAGTESGIFYSSNGGRSWEETGFPTQLAPVLSLALSPAFARDSTLYAGTEQHGLLRSSDAGASWARVAEDAVAGQIDAIVLAPEYPHVPRCLLLGDGLLLSRDGNAWSRLNSEQLGESEPTAVVAPGGLAQGAKLLVAVASGGVIRIVID